MYEKAQKRRNLNRVKTQDCSATSSEIQANDLPQQNSSANQVTVSATNVPDEAIDVLNFVGFKL